MLHLYRRRDEQIMIGDDITVTVLSFRPGGEVKLGISAPPDVRIDRGEVAEAIRRGEAVRVRRPAEGGRP